MRDFKCIKIIYVTLISIMLVTSVSFARRIYRITNSVEIDVKDDGIRNVQARAAFVTLVAKNAINDNLQVDLLQYVYNPDGTVRGQTLAATYVLNNDNSPLRIDPVKEGEAIVLVLKNKNRLNFHLVVNEHNWVEVD